MHGSGEHTQQQQQAPPHRYRCPPRNEDPTQPPTTVSQPIRMPTTIQANLICAPSPTTTSASSSGGGGNVRNQHKMLRNTIKIGDSILEPAGTLVFAQNDGLAWANGQKIVVNGNKHAVVQANLFPIGPPVLAAQPSPQVTNGNWYVNQQSTSSSCQATNNPTTSSATPDSGIQSVPTSPPSPSYQLLNDREADFENEDADEEDPDDFTDMPVLKPVDEDDEFIDVASTSFGPSTNEANTTPTASASGRSTATPQPTREELPNGMDAEDFLSFSIASNMDPNEIVRRLFAFDADKANSIAMLIKKRCAEESKKKKDMEAEVSSTTPTTPRTTRCRGKKAKSATRTTNSPDVTTSNLPVEPSTSSMGQTEETVEQEKAEVKKRGRKPKKKPIGPAEETEKDDVEVKRVKLTEDEGKAETSQKSATVKPYDPVEYMLKVREMLGRQLENKIQEMGVDMTNLRISHSNTSVVKIGGKRKESFLWQLNEQSKKLRKNGIPVVKKKRSFGSSSVLPNSVKVVKKDEEVKQEVDQPKVARSSMRRSRTAESPDVSIQPVEEKFNGEYYEIQRSVAFSDDIIPLWRAPSLNCGCTKGACTSDMECLNRALRVQCGSECTVPYCSNRRFWKEDCSAKLCTSNGPKSRRNLKTKVARKAGEFLCEFAGEVIGYERAEEKFKENEESKSKIVAIGSQLFIDSTERGNISRFVKHSCKPNSRLEVWSVNGFYRAGIFSLHDLLPNVEVTIDKNRLLPFDMECNCGAFECRKVIKGVKKANAVNVEKIETRRFLMRNVRKMKQFSGLPSILKMEGNDTLQMKMKKVLAAFSFRVRRIDGSMPRSMLPHYNSIHNYLRIKSKSPEPAEFISLFEKWLKVLNDDDLERAFIAIELHYMSSNMLLSAQQSRKSNETSSRARAASSHSTAHPKPEKADLSFLESQFPIGSYDPDDAWETYMANPKDNAVRCICGALDEDGEMVQCDKCSFWVHTECCELKNTDNDFICDFCLGKQGPRPTVDVKLMEQPEVRFESCSYYRSLMNRRGLQVRLNETVYVNRGFNEDHKSILRNLREEKKGVVHKDSNKYKFPKAPTDPIPPKEVHRKDARIFRVERLFTCPGNNRYVFGSFYAWPHETFVDNGRLFGRQEVFATSLYETLPLDEVIGRCLVVDKTTWSTGRPKVPKYKEDDVFFCEMQVGKSNRSFDKVTSRHHYPINKNPYVFTKFPQAKKVVRDFRLFNQTSPKSSKNPSAPSPVPTSSTHPLPIVDMKTQSKKNILRVLKRLKKKE